MIRHNLEGRGQEPKLNQVKERVKPFEGNYQSVYQDYVEHKIGESLANTRECCTVTRPEKEEMIVISAKRILDEPEMAKQVFHLQSV